MTILEEAVSVATPDGIADAVLLRPVGPPRPAVLHLSDIRGVRPAHLEIARRMAGWGYLVMAPNVFYRTARPPVFDFPFVAGEERSMKRLAELTGPLTPDAMEKDAAAYVDFLATHPAATGSQLAVVGHCFAGALALRAAAVRPDRVAVAASLHGGRLATDQPTSPHLLLPRVRARLYFAHADGDGSMPAPAIATLDRALAEWGGSYESEAFAGCRHGWTIPDAAAYQPSAADRALEKVRSLLDASLAAT